MTTTKWIALSMVAALVFLNIVSPLATAQSGEGDLLNLLEQLEESEAAQQAAEEEAPTEEASAQEAAAEEDHNAAEDILDDMEDENWEPSSIEDIEVDEIGADHATFIITEIMYDGTPIENYRIYYSNTTLATVQDYDQIADAVVEVEEVEDDELDEGMVKIMLENLTPETTYYVLVAPVHPTDESADPINMISDEVTFTTDEEEVSADTKVFDNVSYTFADNNVTVTWDPSELATTAEVHIRHQSEGSYTLVGEPSLDEGEITFQVDKTGNYFLKLIALDGEGEPVGKEHIQTVKIDEVEEVAPEVPTAPQVGPTANALIGLMIFAFIVYLVYRFRRIEK